jgi:hypothetical protein
MRKFFHGWRRRAGCILLIMAITLAGVWVRGIVAPKTVEWPLGNQTLLLTTNNGRLIWEWANRHEIADEASLLSDQRRMSSIANVDEHQRMLRFRSPVLCLTLLSAYLILWKPRKQA